MNILAKWIIILLAVAGYCAWGCSSKSPEATGVSADSTAVERERASVEGETLPDTATGDAADMAGGFEDRPPKVSEVTLEFDPLEKGGGLRAAVKAIDPEGDEVTFEYIWTKNFREEIDFSGNPLPREYLARGDVIEVEVIPFDREGEGEGKKSPRLGIENFPPRITSDPEASVSGTTFSYQVRAEDPDGDLVSFSLRKAPPGMEIDEKSGLVRWDSPQPGKHEVEVVVKDSQGGEAAQQFAVELGEVVEEKSAGEEAGEKTEESEEEGGGR